MIKSELDLKFVTSNKRRLAKQCPCGEKSNKDGKFVPFDIEPYCYGYCHSCDKTFFPESSNGNENEWIGEQIKIDPFQTPGTDFLELDDVFAQMKAKSYKGNNFVQGIIARFGFVDAVKWTINSFGIGTSKHWKGATVFPQIDSRNRVWQMKVMLYDAHTLKRMKKETHPEIFGKHPDNFYLGKTILKSRGNENPTCKTHLFGLHQILFGDPNKPIAIVESEKTAVVMSIVDNTKIWVATAGKGNLDLWKLKGLKNRSIILFPDARGRNDKAGETPFDKWANICELLNFEGFNVKMYRLLEERYCPEIAGFDLADFVLNPEYNKLIGL